MSWRSPAEQADEPVLEDEDYANASVEAAEVVGHERERECGSSNIFGRASVDWSDWVTFRNVFGGYNLGEDPGEETVLDRYLGRCIGILEVYVDCSE